MSETIWNIYRDYRLQVSQWGDDRLMLIGNNEGGRLYDYEAAKRLHDAIGEIVEQIRPKTKTERRVVWNAPPPTAWYDTEPHGIAPWPTLAYGHIETREVPA